MLLQKEKQSIEEIGKKDKKNEVKKQKMYVIFAIIL